MIINLGFAEGKLGVVGSVLWSLFVNGVFRSGGMMSEGNNGGWLVRRC